MLRNLLTRSFPPLLALTLGAAGCDTDNEEGVELSSSGAQKTAAVNARQNLDYLDDQATNFGDSWRGIAALLGDDAADADSESFEGEAEQDGEDGLGEAADFIEEDVMAPANIEDEGRFQITYRLGAPFCERYGDEIADCREFLEDVPVRIVATSPEENAIDLTLRIGNRGSEPLRLSLHPTRLALEIDLHEILEAAKEIAESQDRDAEIPEMTARGKLLVELVKTGANTATARAAISEAIAVTVDAESGVANFAVALSEIVLDVAQVGESVDAQLRVDLGSSSFSMPADMAFEDVAAETFHGAASGLTFTATAEADQISLSGVSLGAEAAYVALDATKLVVLDLNPNMGREFDLVIARVASEVVDLRFDPGFDLGLLLNLAPIADELEDDGEDLPDWAMDENFGLTLDGSDQPTLRVSELEDDAGQVEVRSGRLTFTSKAHGETIIDAGQCLLADEQQDDDAHPFDGVEAVECR